MDQRNCIKICVNNEIKSARTFEMLTGGFDESAMSTTLVQLWYKRFKEGQKDVNDDDRLGWPSTSTSDENNEAVKKMILGNIRITIREIADDVCISFGSCQVIFTDVLGIKRAAVKIVPKLLNLEQKQRCMDINQEMLTTCNGDPELLKKVTTGDESWEYGNDIENKVQSSQWKPICYDWGDKRKIETGTVGDTKKHVSEVFGKNAGISVLYLRGVTLKATSYLLKNK